MATTLGFRLTGVGYIPVNRNLTDLEHKLLKTVFAEGDRDQKGYLNREDLKVAMVSLCGYKPSKYEATQILERHGYTTEEGLFEAGRSRYLKKAHRQKFVEKAFNICVMNYGQFVEAMTPKLINKDEDDEIRQTFMAFDTHCKGFLTADDLKRVFATVAPHIGVHHLELMFRELDRDGDGRVSYKDFDFMMKFDPLS